MAKKKPAPTEGKFCWTRDDLLTGVLVCHKVSDFLDGLVAKGSEKNVTPRVVAERLGSTAEIHGWSISGLPGSEQECPLAKALGHHLADFFGWDLIVSVNQNGAFLGLPVYPPGKTPNRGPVYMGLHVPLPDPVPRFIRMFDDGSFCQLRSE